MTNIWNNFISAATPAVLLFGRIGIAVLAILLLIRCCRSLFAPQGEKEIWGFLSLSNGARYELYHWENMIGRSRSADIRINFPSVSRTHAAICRNEAAQWRVYPLNSHSGVLLNGTRVHAPQLLSPGDSIAVGGVELFFFPATEQDEARQAQRRTKAGMRFSPAVGLWLLTLIQLLMILQFMPGWTEDTYLPILAGFCGLGGLSWLLYGLYRLLHRTAFEQETLLFFLVTIGFSVIAAYDPPALYKHLVLVMLGILLYLLMSFLLRNLRLSMALRGPAAAAAVGLLAFNILFGERIFGAKNWVCIGPISFQPSEFIKIEFILAGAATLDRLFAKRNLIFTLLFSAFCVGSLALMSDFGTALIFFIAFLCIAFLRTGDLPSIVMMSAAAGFAGAIVLHFKPYVADRFSAWLHAWEYTQTTGYQQSRTMSAIAAGGLFGTGPENGWLKYLGAANTDLVFGVVGETFGLLVAVTAVAAILVLAFYALRCASRARSAFYTITSCSTAAMLVFQTALNVLGAVDLLPLTGVTFPFVSMGGSSMIACWGLAAFLKAADTRQNAAFSCKLPKSRASDTPDDPSESEDFFDENPQIPVDRIFRKDGEGQ